MGALSWYRAATKAVGLSPLPEFHNLEALLEAEEGKPHYRYRLLSYVVPPILAVTGAVAVVASGLAHNLPGVIAGLGFLALTAGSWVLFDRLDKTIAPSRAKIRELSEKIWERYKGFSNIVGVEPALSPAVGRILDEAAGIYLKHSNSPAAADGEAQARTRHALEDAMAKMLELGAHKTASAQELELASGWAPQLLREMREADRALDRNRFGQNPAISVEDPLRNLREARLELERVDTAIEELEQSQG